MVYVTVAKNIAQNSFDNLSSYLSDNYQHLYAVYWKALITKNKDKNVL